MQAFNDCLNNAGKESEAVIHACRQRLQVQPKAGWDAAQMDSLSIIAQSRSIC
jgi:hypothetical protein